ncbi:hypothetical protein [Loigolactobacillus jiayinensis]|uniref:Uncharacterized protein n=1 Tax=Loigolactobacillus jiayinensis TaxID=2486016 RepID=A0ABW1REC6_9LACO|nr:hypothetical protein [Loigolactobacillus jiayinensis]
MSLLAIVTGFLTLANYYFLTGQTYSPLIGSLLQTVLLIATIRAVFSYRGRKQRSDYQQRGYQIFTWRFAIIIFSFLGNIAVFVVILLNLFGQLNQF